MAEGMFITLEGGEGAGKSTQCRLLADFLRGTEREVVLTREPGGSPGAEALREVLLFGKASFSPRAEIMAMFAARQDHVDRVIGPALARGAVVVCDRFTDSTRAYQGYGRAGEDAAVLGLINDLERLLGVVPHLTLLLTVPRDVARARLLARGGRADRFEAADEAFHERLDAGFAAIARRESGRVVTCDAGGDVGDVSRRIGEIVTARMA